MLFRSLYLPRSQLPAAAGQSSTFPIELPHGSGRIFVVEDDVEVRRAAVAVLHQLGYETIEASNAEDALKLFNTAPQIDLLLTDVVLPGRLRGRDLADLIRKASPETEIVFMSGYTENAIVHDGKLDEGV